MQVKHAALYERWASEGSAVRMVSSMTSPLSVRGRAHTSLLLLLSAVALVLTAIPAVPAAAQGPHWSVERFEAADGTGTSVVAARRLWPAPRTVVIARGDEFADALAAAPVAAVLDAPLLLTDSGQLPAHVWEQIEHDHADRAVIMGGSAAVGDGVVAQLRDELGILDVERIQGPNRFETAAAAASFVRANGGTADPIVVRGEGAGHIGGWEDAMAVSQHAALLAAPILLTRPDSLPGVTRARLAELAPDGVTVVGGTAAVSDGVASELGSIAPVQRLAGPSRYETSTAVADATLAAGADPSRVFLAPGTNWQDALVAGATAGALCGVLLYANPHVWDPSWGRTWLLDHAADIDQVIIVADRSRLSTDVDFELGDLANPQPAPQIPGNAIRIQPGDDAAASVAAAPPGSTFAFTSGLHRGVHVEPRDGDTFVGETGALLSGAVPVDTSGVQASGSTFTIPGITVEPPMPSYDVEMEAGREGESRAVDLFAGDRRLTQVGDPAAVTAPGLWHLDTDDDRIVMFDDPRQLPPLELSVTHTAFASTAADVTVRDLRMERYATLAKPGVIDAHIGRRWVIDRVHISESHGPAIRTGYGAVVRNSRLVHNGQIAIGGGDRLPDGSQAPVLIENNEIAYNGEIGFLWAWEAGGAKMTSALRPRFVNNWAHHNRGPGLWCDLDCQDPEWTGNLSEHNDWAGILNEETYGGLIQSNVLRANGVFAVGDTGAGLWISNSPGVEVAWNVMEANRLPLVASHNGIEPGRHGELGIFDLHVHDNDIRVDAQLPGMRVTTGEVDRYHRDDIRFEGNVYRLNDARPAHFWAGRSVGVEEWQSEFGNDLQGTFLSADVDATFSPPQAFDRVAYGPVG